MLGAALAPDGRHVALLDTPSPPGGRRLVMFLPAGLGGRAHLFDGRTGPAVGLPSEPRALAFNPDGSRLAVVCAAGQMVLLDPGTGRVTGQLQHGFPRGLATQDGVQFVMNGGVRFAPDGQTLAT